MDIRLGRTGTRPVVLGSAQRYALPDGHTFSSNNGYVLHLCGDVVDLWRGLVHGRTSLDPADTLGKPDVIVVSMSHWMGGFGFFIHTALLAKTRANCTATSTTWLSSRNTMSGWHIAADMLAALKIRYRVSSSAATYLANVWIRRVSPVAPRPRECPLTKQIAVVRARPEERVLMPHSGPSAAPPGLAQEGGSGTFAGRAHRCSWV